MDDPKTLIIGGGIIVSFISILIYGVLAVLFPEWVGIAGRVARSAEQSHQENSEASTHVFDKISE
ncbi:hypothetical protein [Bdellovibrio sp. HCB337]|uniref:hypothetical protein n=1 Tax=Bdellovibrio sp. HCB337 TaxID=3394358 RepID=UPI0039A52D6D